ncbi:50S ribosomal protein L24 [Persicitalea jodogahamensis]|uniref:Large ribosomal subunit protein uL24 n=1 Tax=Persicitalea jodogahamensis TaxID=402147 RepID=A0A8J3D1F3_9BACT|nr:50S ribosomal protein L24 [Persicitalea jodogahamensis]GHB53495.1 50S ribosomal protein L24 [Persicitalea jodogahamensis]
MDKKKKMQPKFHIRSGDTVKVISGNSKGKTGKVVAMQVDKERAIVEGANMITKHLKPNANNPQGSIEKREASIHLSNLMLVDPATGEPTRTGRRLNDAGKLQRYSKKTDKFI